MKQLHQTLSFISLVTLTAFAISTTSCSKKGDDKPNETVVYTENFDNPNTTFWPTGPSGAVDRKVSDGFFSVTFGGTTPMQFKHWSTQKLFGPNDKKQAVEIAIQHAAGHKYDSGGILFAVKDATYILGFEVGEKEFRVYSRINGTTTQLINWKASSAIKGGLNEVNKLRVTLVDNKLTFYINGTEVGVLQSEGITSLEFVGYGIVKGDAAETTYKVDYVKSISLK
jgi:hypothetical protein